MKQANMEVRNQIKKAGLRYWQVAEAVGVYSSTLTVWLRTPLTEQRRSRIEKALQKLEGAEVNV